jgi:hypothetical protein
MKRFIIIGIILCVAVLVFTLMSRQCGARPDVSTSPAIPEEDPLTLEWSVGTLVMNAGETSDIEWVSNKTIQPLVYCEGSAVAVIALQGNRARIRAIAGGVDVLTVKHGPLQSVCVITVNEGTFSFDWPGKDGQFDGIEVRVGELVCVDIVTEPVSLPRQSGISCRIHDETIAGIFDFADNYVTVEGRKQGYTTLIAEWRGKQTEVRLKVIDNKICVITVPYTKQYLNIGQETKITARLENGEAGDETRFNFTMEPGKNSLSVDEINGTALVKALREGAQYIKISHPLAKDSIIITFDVLPPAPPPPPLIELSESPLLLAKGETKPLTMTVVNGKAADNQKFSFQVAENAYAVEAKQRGNILNITGIAPGAALIRISNGAVNRDYELMVVVDSYDN